MASNAAFAGGARWWHCPSQPAKRDILPLLRLNRLAEAHEGKQRGRAVVASATASAPQAAEAVADTAAATTAGSRAASKHVSSRAKAALAESLGLLEFPALCRQLASFCQTPQGCEQVLRLELPVGASQQESEMLLQETAEAQSAQLTFRDVYDISRVLDAAEAGQVLLPLVLDAVASTLAAASDAEAALAAAQPPPTALLRLAAGIAGGLPDVQAAIRACIQPGDGRILDSASEALAHVRQQRRANAAQLQREMEGWARRLHAKGICERPQVVLRRDRQCVPVRLGRQGELPRGSVTLATSASGSTMYMEPEPCVALNNAEMALAGAEAAEEQRVLAQLSELVAEHAAHVRRAMASLAALDVTTARGRHASWLGAARPRFLSAAEAAACGPVNVPAALHPLLLQPSLPPLPALPLTEAQQQQYEQQQQQQQPGEQPAASEVLSGLALVPELAAAAAPAPLTASGSSSNAPSSTTTPSSSSGHSSSSTRPPPPRPVDLSVPAGTAVVAVTGPNTGGKTASLKTLGLLSLMAKAGLFLPQQPDAAAGGQDGPGPSQQQPALLWFDRVLADLGDGQSLQQSLSTFSGHVRRIRGVLAAATPKSLVGSGTDPAEGAALAASLLLHLRATAALTYATTHHAELKELATSTPGFVNASVEFDAASLRPTYRLLWGQAGDSNALSIAAGLGFSAAVVEEARGLAGRLREAAAAPDRGTTLQASLAEQVQEAQHAAARAASRRQAAEAELAAAKQELADARAEVGEAGSPARKESLAAAGARARGQVSRLLTDVREGRITPAQAEERLRALEAAARPSGPSPLVLAGLRAGGDAVGGASSRTAPADWVPRAGEAVRVLKMGGAPGTVVSGSGRPGSKVSVRVGTMTVELRVADLAPAGKGGGSGAAAQPAASTQQALGAARKARRAGSGGGDGSAAPAGLAATAGVALQTAANTVDVRGQTADDAESTVRDAVAGAPPGWTLFVVHGVGTGRVRAAVLAALRRHPRVARVEEEERSNGGCSIVTVE